MQCIWSTSFTIFVLLPKKEEAGRLCREKLAENEEAVSQGARGRAGGRRLWLRAACHGLQYVFLHSFLKTQSQTRCFFTTFTIKNWNFEVVYPVFDTSIWYWKDLWIYDIWERAYICILYTYIYARLHMCMYSTWPKWSRQSRFIWEGCTLTIAFEKPWKTQEGAVSISHLAWTLMDTSKTHPHILSHGLASGSLYLIHSALLFLENPPSADDSTSIFLCIPMTFTG